MFKTLKISNIRISLIWLSLFVIFMFFNPDIFMGIADHYVFLILFIITSFFEIGNIIINKKNFYSFFLICYMIIPTLVSIFFGKLSSGYFLSYLLYFLSIFIVSSINYSHIEKRFIVNCYIFSALLISFLIIFQKYDYYGSGGERFTIKILNHEAFDPNFLSAYLVVPILLLLGDILKKVKLSKLFILLIIVLGMLFTSSRGAVVSTLIGAFIIFILYFKRNKNLKKFIIFTVLSLILLFSILIFSPNNSLIRLLSIDSYKSDRSNIKRLLDWSTGLKSFALRPLLGYGFRGELDIIKSSINSNLIAHNTYIAFLLQFGLIGFLVFLVFFIKLFSKCKENYILIGCLISTIVVIFFVSAEVSVFMWLPILVCIILSNKSNNFFGGGKNETFNYSSRI